MTTTKPPAAEPRLTYKAAELQLHIEGVRLRRSRDYATSGEYRVCLKGGTETYHTTDLQDAVTTGLDMARRYEAAQQAKTRRFLCAAAELTVICIDPRGRHYARTVELMCPTWTECAVAAHSYLRDLQDTIVAAHMRETSPGNVGDVQRLTFQPADWS